MERSSTKGTSLGFAVPFRRDLTVLSSAVIPCPYSLLTLYRARRPSSLIAGKESEVATQI